MPRLNPNAVQVKTPLGQALTHFIFSQPQACLSWAPWNGGLKRGILGVVNRTLEPDEVYPDQARPLARWISRDLSNRGISPNPTVCLLTTVPQVAMRSGQYSDRATGLTVDTFCTLGLGNALAPGDPALYNEELGMGRTKHGTINLVVVVNRGLTHCAMHEMMSVITQAKCAVLAQHSQKSRLSGHLCLGTGTDCIALCAPQTHKVMLRYAGLHTKLAEIAARSVMEAVSEALATHLAFVARSR